MNYKHSYHAGSFTDVLKHTVLIAQLMSLTQKPTACCYLESHAGAGFYDLLSPAAQKNKEHALGIAKLLQQKNPPHVVAAYLRAVQSFNQQMTQAVTSSLRYYPGSPVLAQHFLRPHDRMVLCELHPVEFQLLKTHFAHAPSAQVHLMDGYQGLKAFLPPKERRGLVLIDPPYERPNEFEALRDALSIALKRFMNGIYAIWYPLKNRQIFDRFFKNIKKIIHQPLLKVELTVYPDSGPALLNGSGMLIINPPWQLEQQVAEFLPFLWQALSHAGQGHYSIQSF